MAAKELAIDDQITAYMSSSPTSWPEHFLRLAQRWQNGTHFNSI
jgi:hypothetical protein